MRAAPTGEDVELFRDVVARRVGLRFDDGRLGQLAELLERRLGAVGEPPGPYLARLQAGANEPELRVLVRELTVAETYFFRNVEQFRALAEVALPARMQAQAGARRLRILSAGCASGEEPFSLAIVVAQSVPEPPWTVSIRGIDVNPAVLERAAQGRYSAWALRETPAETRARWFTASGRDFVLDPGLRSRVTFEERNLTEPAPDLWQPGAWDIVFCRNILMYFTRDHAAALVARIAAVLAPGGYLFLGHAETLRGLSQDFHVRHTHGTFYYERRASARERPATPLAAMDAATDAALPQGLPEATADAPTSWVEAIQKASERIETLASSARRPSPAVGGRPKPLAAWSLGAAVELLKTERFDEALELLHGLPPESHRDPDVQLLRATLLTHSGRLEDAQRVCEELLEADDLSAGAHYLLALCREARDDIGGAQDHDQVAAYLDPGFAMPRLHLGLMARRSGDVPAARRELTLALELLLREDSSRLLLFGGGFTRDALLALCRAELSAAGASA